MANNREYGESKVCQVSRVHGMRSVCGVNDVPHDSRVVKGFQKIMFGYVI